MKPMRQKQLGLVLPTVLALAMLSSILLMAEWRALGLAEGFGQIAFHRWALQQASHAALLAAVQDIQGPLTDARHQPGNSKATHAFFPTNTSTWKTLQTRLGTQDCLSGICKPLGEDSNSYGVWLARWTQAQSFRIDSQMQVVYWIEVLPLVASLATTEAPFAYRITAWAQNSQQGIVVSQALWHPTPSRPASTGLPMQMAGFKRLLQLSP